MDQAGVEGRIAKTLAALDAELVKIRAGRAHAGLLDQVRVPCYGQEMPLPQVATVNVGGNRLLTVSPWNPENLAAVEKAIRDSGLGLNPGNDGGKVLVTLPELSEERRVELGKLVKREAESSRVAVRNIRRAELGSLRDRAKAGEMGESDRAQAEKALQVIVDKAVKSIDDRAARKVEELMQV